MGDAKSHDDISNIRKNHNFFRDIPKPNSGQFFLDWPRCLLSNTLQFPFNAGTMRMFAMAKKVPGVAQKFFCRARATQIFFDDSQRKRAAQSENARKMRAFGIKVRLRSSRDQADAADAAGAAVNGHGCWPRSPQRSGCRSLPGCAPARASAKRSPPRRCAPAMT